MPARAAECSARVDVVKPFVAKWIQASPFMQGSLEAFCSAGLPAPGRELSAYPDSIDPSHPVVLFDQSATRHYLAQTGFINATEHVGLRLGLGRAFSHPDHHHQRTSLIEDAIDGHRQGASAAQLGRLQARAGNQHRRVQGKAVLIGARCSADETDHRGSDGTNGTRAVVDFDDLDPV